jgi:sulfur relay (sulfurtransferase) DsrC/TusE family protein
MRKCTSDILPGLANKLITRLRAGWLLEPIKAKLKADGIKNREDVKRMVEYYWRIAQNIRLVEFETKTTSATKVLVHNVKQNLGAD